MRKKTENRKRWLVSFSHRLFRYFYDSSCVYAESIPEVSDYDLYAQSVCA